MEQRHRWTPPERERTIDIYLKHQHALVAYGKDVVALSRELDIPFHKVLAAVDAVGSLDVENPRKVPGGSKALRAEWARRNQVIKSRSQSAK